MPTTTTIAGWAAILAVGGAYYWVNGQRKQKNLRSANTKQSSKATEPRKDTKAKKSKKDGGLSSGDQDVKQDKKKKAKQPAKPAVEEPIVASSLSKTVDRDEKRDDLEFARQLSNAKKGVVDTPKSQTASRQKSVKQTRAQEKPVVDVSEDGTAPSSTTGGDADDDQSPINSPELAATTATNGDVSDMLEKPSAGPSVLRVTAPTNPAPAKKAKQQNFEVQETKKQKQNRKKAEEAKAIREAEEKERKVKLEAHRRSVREAEGRAAKDGSVFMASQAPPTSKWTAAPAVQATNDSATPASKKLELLDTYEPSSGHVDTKPVEQIKSESKLAEELANIPEDEQLRIAKEESNNWEEVKSSYNRKKKTRKEASDENKESKEDKTSSSNDDSNDFGVPPVIAPTGPGKKWQMTTVHVEPNGKVVEREQEVQDSEWEVA
ncbi:hypothetical protein ONS95_004951 [Cadophora gregata]|uniref:uncharacterized protein n=1 Tax=Cadophora gregata TaxID=51156 RepID=UPI0026DD9071|nr:uncharacterized protein ONS95_004951 [Cadophora gregata]KAK0104677.1 hypothetical protein ONS95_004951 [Cadophora gregata]